MIAEGARSRFQPLDGERPILYTSTHPKEPLVALRTQGREERAGVWDLETGKLVWAPEAAYSALCWNRSGSVVYVIRSHGTWPYDPWAFECLSWPDRSRIGSCGVRAPEGWTDGVIASPIEDLVVFMWTEQGCAGFEFVDFRMGEPRQLRGSGYSDSPNTQDGPVFSPDGRWLVASYGNDFWWGENPETPSAGGRFVCGKMVIGDLHEPDLEKRFKVFPLEVEIPEGWRTQDPNDITSEIPLEPTFLDAQTFSIILPTGEKRVYDTQGRLRETPMPPGSIDVLQVKIWEP